MNTPANKIGTVVAVTFEPYETYSTARGLLWGIEAAKLNEDAKTGCFEPVPIDGDAPARRDFQSMNTMQQWDRLTKYQIDQIKNNHHDADRINPR